MRMRYSYAWYPCLKRGGGALCLVDENPTNEVQDHLRKTFSKQTFVKAH